jgi:hypothetical protein
MHFSSGRCTTIHFGSRLALVYRLHGKLQRKPAASPLSRQPAMRRTLAKRLPFMPRLYQQSKRFAPAIRISDGQQVSRWLP